MDGFQRRKAQKEKDILEAALLLFTDYGIQKVAISDIAKKANVSQVTIYNYFESKHNLIHVTFIYYVNQLVEDFAETVRKPIPFQDKIKDFIFKKGKVAKEIHIEFYQYIMKEYEKKGNYIEEIYQKKALPLYIELFKEGKELGYINPALSDEAIFFYIQMIKEYLQRDDAYNKALPLSEELTEIFFYGIVGNQTN